MTKRGASSGTPRNLGARHGLRPRWLAWALVAVPCAIAVQAPTAGTIRGDTAVGGRAGDGRQSIQISRRAGIEPATFELHLDQAELPLATGIRFGEHQREAQPTEDLVARHSFSHWVEAQTSLRARLLTIGPLILQRHRAADVGGENLDGRQDERASGDGTMQPAPPSLADGVRPAPLRRDMQDRRARVLEHREGVEHTLTARAHERARGAQHLAAIERGWQARAGSLTVQSALGLAATEPRGKGVLHATITGRAVRATALAEEAGARRASLARAAGVLPVETALQQVASALGDHYMLMATHGPRRVWIKGTLSGVGDRPGFRLAASLDLSVLQTGRMAATPARVAPARAYRPEPPVRPLPGEIIRRFGDGPPRVQKPWIAIAAAPGQAVAAPDDGHVVFAGAFKSYGLLLIIEHSREYHTLLWGFSRIDVASGEKVRAGQIVGVMGTDDGGTSELHVELRRNGRPVNPMPWLAASMSKVRS